MQASAHLRPLLAALALGLLLLPAARAQSDAREPALSATVTVNAPIPPTAPAVSGGSLAVGGGSLWYAFAGDLALGGSLTTNSPSLNFGSAVQLDSTSAITITRTANLLTAVAQVGQPFRFQWSAPVAVSDPILNSSIGTLGTTASGTLTINSSPIGAGYTYNPATGQWTSPNGGTLTPAPGYAFTASGVLTTVGGTRPASAGPAAMTPPTETPAVAFSAAGLPVGLSMDAATGLVSGVPTQAGDFTVTLTATTAPAAAVSRTLALTVTPVPPVVTLTVPSPRLHVGSGQPGLFTVTLSAAQTRDLTVNYTVRGDAVNGTDYVLLTGVKKIKAGHAARSIKIVPKGPLTGASRKAVKLTLAPGTGYTVGTAAFIKLELVDGP